MRMDTESVLQISRVRSLTRSGAARTVRIAAGLTLGELAEAVGVSPTTIWRWEQGQRSPRGEPAIKYGELLEALMKSPR